MIEWESFTEIFDSESGGPLYCADDPETGDYLVAGVLWLDGGQDDDHYYGFVAGFYDGYEGDWGIVKNKYDACDVFQESVDSNVILELGDDDGWFPTLDDGVDAVEEFIAGGGEVYRG